MAEDAFRQLTQSLQQLALGTYVQMTSDLEPFSGAPSECIDICFNKFRVITNMGIPDGIARLLVLKLKGEARTFIQSLPAAQLTDFTTLQTALQNQYHEAIHVNAVRAQLHS